MELAADHLVWGTIFIFLPSFIILLRKWKHSTQTRLPPGPPGWPILGNLLDLGTMPHKSLTVLGKYYGLVIWLRPGSLNTMVILSTNAANEFFKNHDVAFSDRFLYQSSRIHDYYQSSLTLCPYGLFWRTMHRVISFEILVNHRINETARYLDQMLVWIEEEANRDESGKGIPIGKLVSLTSYSVIGIQMLSRDFLDPTKEGKDFFEAVKIMVELIAYANLADYFPFLKRWDLQGLNRKLKRAMGEGIEMAGMFVKERVKEKKLGVEITDKDFLDVLLEFEGTGKDEPAQFSEKDISIFILEIFMAGAESTSSTVKSGNGRAETMIKTKAEC